MSLLNIFGSQEDKRHESGQTQVHDEGALHDVLAIEHEAQGIIDEAEAQAKRIVADAERQADELVRAAQRDAEAQAIQAIQVAINETHLDTERITANAEQIASTWSAQALPQVDHVVAQITRIVTLGD